MNEDHPVRFSVDYPDRPLDRLTTAFRIFTVIPIAIVLGVIGGYSGGGGYGGSGGDGATVAIGGSGLLFLPPLLMIVFREKYPRWWYDWNLELLRFTNRVGTYLALMSDRYPSTDERQSVQLDFPYPDARRDLNRWLPLVKWLLAIPHYIVLFFLYVATFIVLIGAWFAILFTGRYPRGIFEFVEGVIRWHEPRRRLRLHPRHRPLPAVLPESARGRATCPGAPGAAWSLIRRPACAAPSRPRQCARGARCPFHPRPTGRRGVRLLGGGVCRRGLSGAGRSCAASARSGCRAGDGRAGLGYAIVTAVRRRGDGRHRGALRRDGWRERDQSGPDRAGLLRDRRHGRPDSRRLRRRRDARGRARGGRRGRGAGRRRAVPARPLDRRGRERGGAAAAGRAPAAAGGRGGGGRRRARPSWRCGGGRW